MSFFSYPYTKNEKWRRKFIWKKKNREEEGKEVRRGK